MPNGYDGTALRAVVVARDGAEKVGQRYTDPLLVLSGGEYTAAGFDRLHHRICDALRGGRPRVIGEWEAGGVVRLVFEDGSTRESGPAE